MIWFTYVQSNGNLYFGQIFEPKEKRVLLAKGYSGNGVGLNNYKYEHVVDVGPITMGEYEIGPAFRHKRLGPYCMRLTPRLMVGYPQRFRTDFMIHGDNKTLNNTASKGCIVVCLDARRYISDSAKANMQTETRLMVVRDMWSA